MNHPKHLLIHFAFLNHFSLERKIMIWMTNLLKKAYLSNIIKYIVELKQ